MIAGSNYPYFPLTGGMQNIYSNSEVNIQTLYEHTEVYVIKPYSEFTIFTRRKRPYFT